MSIFLKKTPIPVPQKILYDWHASGGAFFRLAPPWEQIEIQDWKGGEKTRSFSPSVQFGDISKGAQISLRTKVGPIWQSMRAEHVAHKKPEMFADQMVQGPFSYWLHEHRFVAQEKGHCILEDEIEYKLPLSPFSNWIAGGFVRNKLEKMFTFRHQRTLRDLEQKMKYDHTCKKIAVTGASGLVGQELCAFLRGMGHEVYTVSRKRGDATKNILSFDDVFAWEGLDAVVHLAGEPIAGRWTVDKKNRIQNSRVQLTSRIATLLSKLDKPPEVLISASAVGFYGDRGEEDITEDSSSGVGFLPNVCRMWEEAVAPAQKSGIRCVHPRFGVVLTPKGGALKKMLLPFRMGAGGPVGSGKQWMSWISIDDLIYLLYFLIQNSEAKGAVNATAPNPVRNKEFGQELGRALSRPSFMPLPSVVVRTLFGEMGQALLLDGAKIFPKNAEKLGYSFVHTNLKDCFADIL
jgi:uncharacterized protein (TIGR01777 family)